mmetsp:Transcript_18562/g.45586  ORF Transcript_18562/g.45586 Transcript_18562/m.45586 type:complete len:649 (-) Transcript_18562:1451-3397(-)
MFWRLGFAQQSPVEELLETDNFTLQQLLDEEDLIQECKQLNKKLVDFLSIPEQLEALLHYIVDEPPADGEDKEKFIYPYKSSEVLATDLTPVNDCLFAHPNLVNLLLSILEREPPLGALPAGYFAKVMLSLLSRRPEETIKVIEDYKVVPMLLKHIAANSILELLLKVVSEVEESMHVKSSYMGSMRQEEDNTGFGRTQSKHSDNGQMEESGIGSLDIDSEWLHHLNLVESLIEKLAPENSPEVHANASAALCGLITSQSQSCMMSAHAASNSRRLVLRLLVAETANSLLERAFKGSPSSLEHGLTVIVELVRMCTSMRIDDSQRNPSDQGKPNPTATVHAISGRMGDLVGMLTKPPAIAPITNTTGTLDPPMGSIRLKVIDVLHALISLADPVVEEHIVQSKVLPICLDLFFKYEWCNLLHNTVKQMLDAVLTVGGTEIKKCLFTDCDLLGRIMKTFEHEEGQTKVPTRGYMGHLRLLSNKIEDVFENNLWMRVYIKAGDWRAFVEGPLNETNEVNDRRKLGDKEQESINTSMELSDVSQPSSFEFRVHLLNEQLFATDDDGDVEGVGMDDEDDDDHAEAGAMADEELIIAAPVEGELQTFGSPDQKKESPQKSPAQEVAGDALAKVMIKLTLRDGKPVADVAVEAI